MGASSASRIARVVIALGCVAMFFVATSSSPSKTELPELPEASYALESTGKRPFYLAFLPTCTPNVSHTPVDVDDDGQFPPDYFTLKQRQKGAVLLHVCGLIYMFVALAIVCDEFFVPSLAVLTDKLAISDDVAGATFMAAGGSAPEFFTSVIGVFIAQNNVGIGTIVGSATFNILCVLACCTLFSNTVLQLTWWPLFRDVTIYIIALMMLVIFFFDEQITWPEALSLFIVYIVYCTIMKFNVQIEIFVKTKILHESMEEEISEVTILNTPINATHNGDTQTLEYKEPEVDRRNSIRRRSSQMGRRQSLPILHSGSMFRTGIMQLMNQTLEQLPEGGESEEDSASRRSGEVALSVEQEKHQHTELTVGNQMNMRRISSHVEEIKSILEEEEEKPLDMSWPDEWLKRITYLALAPILIPMWVTIPDVRKPKARKWYPFTFLFSILWIAFFSYLMVWWANTIGETLIIPTEVIGLTILAAGTSIPDLITSVIVARKGLGDMAVSSSVGSNIFDVTVGLPVPWLLYFIIEPLRSGAAAEAISVSSKGLLCSVGLLFIMLIVLVLATFISHWRMNKIFGVIMIVSYIGFCVFSVLLETDKLKCPLNLC